LRRAALRLRRREKERKRKRPTRTESLECFNRGRGDGAFKGITSEGRNTSVSAAKGYFYSDFWPTSLGKIKRHELWNGSICMTKDIEKKEERDKV